MNKNSVKNNKKTEVECPEKWVNTHLEISTKVHPYNGIGDALDLSGFSGHITATRWGGENASWIHMIHYWLDQNPQYSEDELAEPYSELDWYIQEGSDSECYAHKLGNDAQKEFSKWYQEIIGIFENVPDDYSDKAYERDIKWIKEHPENYPREVIVELKERKL